MGQEDLKDEEGNLGAGESKLLFTEMVEVKKDDPRPINLNNKTFTSEEEGIYSSKLKYEESKVFHISRALLGSLLLLWGVGTFLIPFTTFSIVSILLGVIVLPDSWRRNTIKFIKKMPYLGKKLCPFLERIEENIEDTEVSFFKLLSKRDS